MTSLPRQRMYFLFFQAEDGIRDYKVTGVQTCALPISMGKASWTDGVEFRTVNGGITLDLPPSLSAEVRAETVNGEIFTDFPLTVTGKLGPRRVTGTIGGGGRQLALSTVNGNIRLRKAG